MLTESVSRVTGLVQKMLCNKRRTKKCARILVSQSQLILTMLPTLRLVPLSWLLHFNRLILLPAPPKRAPSLLTSLATMILSLGLTLQRSLLIRALPKMHPPAPQRTRTVSVMALAPRKVRTSLESKPFIYTFILTLMLAYSLGT